MRRTTLLTIILFISLFTSCQRAEKRDAQKTQTLLGEAELLLEVRRFDEATSTADEALKKLAPLLDNAPENVDYRLLKVRGLITLFLARNTEVIENGSIQPRSLVRFPNPEDYNAYKELLTPAEEELKAVLESRGEKTVDQLAFIHGTLAAIYRLNANTLDLAITQYEKAKEAYRSSKRALEQETKKVGNNKLAIMKLKNQITGIEMSIAEVSLLREEWQEALAALEASVAGTDLQYFALHFELLENRLVELENLIEADQKSSKGSREEKLLQTISEKKKKKYSLTIELGGLHPHKVEMIQAKIDLAQLQNNLMYRIISYFNMGMDEEMENARTILRTFYPKLDENLITLLEKHQN